jgi:hypothetical protein
VSDLAFISGGSQILSSSVDGTIRIWDISAAIEGRKLDVRVNEGVLAVEGWFQHGLTLGGWFSWTGQMFKFEYPVLVLPAGSKGLDWDIGDGFDEEPGINEFRRLVYLHLRHREDLGELFEMRA